MITVEEANKVIKNCLSEKRYNHSVCVMERCIEYAKIYGLDETKASLMGLLHDMAKEMPKEEKVKYCEEIESLDNVYIVANVKTPKVIVYKYKLSKRKR